MNFRTVGYDDLYEDRYDWEKEEEYNQRICPVCDQKMEYFEGTLYEQEEWACGCLY